jgi:branched-chain amino acid transport system ATP-binding protein
MGDAQMQTTPGIGAPPEVMLDVQAIEVFYGQVQALKGVSLRIDRGEIVTLIGANGAGKSTTLSAISGLIRPRSGKIIYEGRDLSSVPAYDVVSWDCRRRQRAVRYFRACR